MYYVINEIKPEHTRERPFVAEYRRIDATLHCFENRVLALCERYSSRDTRAAHTALEQARLINKGLIDWKRNSKIKGHYYEELYYKDHKLAIRAWR